MGPQPSEQEITRIRRPCKSRLPDLPPSVATCASLPGPSVSSGSWRDPSQLIVTSHMGLHLVCIYWREIQHETTTVLAALSTCV